MGTPFSTTFWAQYAVMVVYDYYADKELTHGEPSELVSAFHEPRRIVAWMEDQQQYRIEVHLAPVPDGAVRSQLQTRSGLLYVGSSEYINVELDPEDAGTDTTGEGDFMTVPPGNYHVGVRKMADGFQVFLEATSAFEGEPKPGNIKLL